MTQDKQSNCTRRVLNFSTHMENSWPLSPHKEEPKVLKIKRASHLGLENEIIQIATLHPRLSTGQTEVERESLSLQVS